MNRLDRRAALFITRHSFTRWVEDRFDASRPLYIRIHLITPLQAPLIEKAAVIAMTKYGPIRIGVG